MNASAEPAEPGLQADQRLVDRAWLRIGIGLLVVGQSMAFSLAVNLTPPEGAAYWILHGGLMLAAAGVLVFLGGDLVRSALDSLRQRRISIDLLFLITLAGAFAGSLVSTVTHTGAVYYEVVAILVVVHTAGRTLGARSRMSALRAVDRTRERFEACDVRLPDGTRCRRSVAAVHPGDVVIVAPGGAISVDGEIVSGRGYVQETSMTGEWRPASRGPGDKLLAGTFSVDGSFEVRPSAGPRRLDGVLAAVAGARLAPSEFQRQADRLVAWFLPGVVTASVATFVFWLGRGPWDGALFNAMAVLLVACPCAMGLATPVAVWGGLARLASFGLVARTGDLLDGLARCDVVCIDKTGTLSTENLSVSSWNTEPAFQERESWLRAAVAAAEDGLNHPIAAALRSACSNAVATLATRAGAGLAVPGGSREPAPPATGDFPLDTLLQVTPWATAAERSRRLSSRPPIGPIELSARRIEPGLGVVAWAADESGLAVEIRIGERALIAAGGSVAPTGNTKRIFVAVGGRLAAGIELAEQWRDGLDDALGELRALGIQVEVLTGDAAADPRRFAGAVVRGGMTPAGKQAHVRALAAAGRRVAFIGDGVNDAAAMSAAQASIAMRAGADLARAAALGVFAGDDLRFLPRAIRIARAVRRSIRVNLTFAAGYNAAGVVLAASGHLHPVVAALLMVGSSAFVSVNALRGSARASAEPALAAAP